MGEEVRGKKRKRRKEKKGSGKERGISYRIKRWLAERSLSTEEGIAGRNGVREVLFVCKIRRRGDEYGVDSGGREREGIEKK